jgi:uncharacterized protein (TIGR02452 family)
MDYPPKNGSERQRIAEETVAILQAGHYQAPSGRHVDIADAVARCVAGTRLLLPEHLDVLARKEGLPPERLSRARIELVDESTLDGIRQLNEDGGGRVAALNFASARNPGGGFLRGTEAQEESLARSSGLHASLLRAPEYYEYHRAQASGLYTDRVIWSPDCPVIRDANGVLLEYLHLASFLTCAAPNAGVILERYPEESRAVEAAFRQRAERVLAVAAAEGCGQLVLGAWGCGVFRNDPAMVAATFRELLVDAGWRLRFERIRFSVLDTTRDRQVFRAFLSAFADVV